MPGKSPSKVASKVDISIMDGIIRQIGLGKTKPAQMASELNIGVPLIREFLRSEVFEKHYAKRDKVQFKLWKGGESSKDRQEAVKTALARDMPNYYTQIKDLLDGDESIRGEKKLDTLLALMKMSNVLEGGHEETEALISPIALDNISATLRELG